MKVEEEHLKSEGSKHWASWDYKSGARPARDASHRQAWTLETECQRRGKQLLLREDVLVRTRHAGDGQAEVPPVRMSLESAVEEDMSSHIVGSSLQVTEVRANRRDR